MKRSASAIWSGNLKQGKGSLTTSSKVLNETPYSYTTRFENGIGTNPEELIAAAHAGCFTMALSALLSKEGFTPNKLSTHASLSFEEIDGKWTINTITLELSAEIPEISKEKLEEIANEAKLNCPISRLLNAKITLKIIFSP